MRAKTIPQFLLQRTLTGINRLSMLGIFLFLLIYCAATGIFVPGFLSMGNLINVVKTASVIGVMASGVTFVMLTGNIDLSCGALMTLMACISCSLIDISPGLAIILPILAGICCGALNGVLVGRLRLNSFVTTLGLLSVYQALTFFYTNGHYYSSTHMGWYRQIGQGSVFGIPILVIIFFAVVLISAFVQKKTVFGSRLYAVGSNPISARFSGIHSIKITTIVYVISGACSALSGIMLCSRTMAAQPKMGIGFELEVLVAVLIGGLSMSKGRGSAWGTFVGALFISVLENSFALMKMDYEIRFLAEGLLLFIAIAIQALSERRDGR